MSQLIFKFPFKTTYFENDFYVSSNNFEAYKLIESWPDWPDKWINIYGPTGCGKTHLSKILEKKICSVVLNEKELTEKIFPNISKFKSIIIDNLDKNFDEKSFFSLLNFTKQLDIAVLILTKIPLKNFGINLVDLKSRLNSFISFGIDLPTDELLKVIITKSFSDKQITVTDKNLNYIVNNIERSYEKVFKFIKDIDDLSLSSGKAINITRTSIAHSISYPLTAEYGIPHGLACSFTIPKILQFVTEDTVINENISLLEGVSYLLSKLDLQNKIKAYLHSDKIEISYEDFLSNRSENFIFKTNEKDIRDFINLNT